MSDNENALIKAMAGLRVRMADDQETIARLTRENIELSRCEQLAEHGPARMAGELQRAEAGIHRLHEEIRGHEECAYFEREMLTGVVGLLGAEQAKSIEQRTTITAIATERDHYKGESKRLTNRLAESKARVDMAVTCLESNRPYDSRVDEARSVLTERDLRRECESCGGPCNVEGDTCLLCREQQPKDSDTERCPPRPMAGVAEACNEGAKQ